MSTMPQLILTAPGTATWTDVPVPTLTGDGDALVRPVAVATCDLDTAINAGRFALPLPYALGHEFVAEVLAVSAGVASVRPGDLVGVPFQISCGDCAPCRRGQTGDCTSVRRGSAYGLGAIGGDGWGGAVAEVVRVPYADAMLVPVPAGLDPAVVASLDNLPDAWRAVAPHLADLADGLVDPRVLVVGYLSIGLYAVAIARALGAEVTYVDSDQRRVDVALKLGATVVAPASGRPGRYPVTVSTGNDPASLLLALASTANGGVCTSTGVFVGDVALPLGQMYTRGVRLVTGRAMARPVLPDLLDLIAAGRLDPGPVTATTANWADAPKAWSAHRDKLVLIR